MTVANLRPEKSHDVLIDAASRILAAYPDAEFVFAGDGSERDALDDACAHPRRSDRVRFLGQRRDVPGVSQAADLFVLPSRSEALPNAVIEAMAAGLPVVASDVGGIPELITPEAQDCWCHLATPGRLRRRSSG